MSTLSLKLSPSVEAILIILVFVCERFRTKALVCFISLSEPLSLWATSNTGSLSRYAAMHRLLLDYSTIEA